jgi:hypothetical protein
VGRDTEANDAAARSAQTAPLGSVDPLTLVAERLGGAAVIAADTRGVFDTGHFWWPELPRCNSSCLICFHCLPACLPRCKIHSLSCLLSNALDFRFLRARSVACLREPKRGYGYLDTAAHPRHPRVSATMPHGSHVAISSKSRPSSDPHPTVVPPCPAGERNAGGFGVSSTAGLAGALVAEEEGFAVVGGIKGHRVHRRPHQPRLLAMLSEVRVRAAAPASGVCDGARDRRRHRPRSHSVPVLRAVRSLMPRRRLETPCPAVRRRAWLRHLRLPRDDHGQRLASVR